MANSMNDWELVLGNRLVNGNLKNRFNSVITRGERGYGKSMYNLKVMAYLFHKLFELSEKDAWLRALDHVIFSPFEYMKRIDYNYRNDVIDPVWCLDDAGVNFTGMLYRLNPDLYGLVNGSFDTLRTVTNSLLITVPYKEKLMKGLQQYDDREITLYIDSGGGEYNRKAVCVKWYRLPSGRREWYKEFEDLFSCYVPKWIYNKYLVKRKEYNKKITDAWKKRLGSLEDV